LGGKEIIPTRGIKGGATGHKKNAEKETLAGIEKNLSAIPGEPQRPTGSVSTRNTFWVVPQDKVCWDIQYVKRALHKPEE